MERKRISTTKIDVTGARLQGGQIFGASATLAFTVAMDNEQATAGNFKQITDLTVKLDGVLLQNLIAEGLKAWKVKQQGPMRDNIDKVEALSGTAVSFNDTLFSTRKVASPMTPEQAEAIVMNQSELQKLALAIKIYEDMGMEVPEELLEREYQLKHPSDEA